MEVYDIVDNTLYLSVNLKASIEHIQNKYLLPLKVCIAEVTGIEYDIKFIPKDATNLQHMELLFYMLFKETLQCKFYIEQEDAKTC